MLNPVGQETSLFESDLDDVMDDMLDGGYEIISEKEAERYQVTKYICSGREIISDQIIPGEHIPVIPAYGEHAVVEDEEHWEGITRLAKDPQRLRNFQLSYLADIVSQSPRNKPIFNPEQIAGFEHMYQENGADNNYPYLLQNRVAQDGTPLPIGPVAQMPEQNAPSALIQSIQLSRQAIEDVANPGTPQDLADPDISGRAVYALQNKIDKQSTVYQDHMKSAKRRDGEVYASMAAAIYDVPRPVTLTKPDGTRMSAKMMETVVDGETGEIVVLNDIYNQEFEVYSEIGPSYSSKKEQTVDRLINMIQMIQPGDPMQRAIILKLVELSDGVDLKDIRDYARKQLVLNGFRDPETDEEVKLLAQAQQAGNKPSAEMLLAMAEMEKAKADQAKVQLDTQKAGLELQVKQQKTQIDMFNAQTKRIDTQIDAQEAGADINMTRVDTLGKQIDNQMKIREFKKPENKSDAELMQSVFG